MVDPGLRRGEGSWANEHNILDDNVHFPLSSSNHAHFESKSSAVIICRIECGRVQDSLMSVIQKVSALGEWGLYEPNEPPLDSLLRYAGIALHSYALM